MICPACKSVEYTTLHTVNSEESVKHILKKTDERFITLQNHVKSLWHGDECKIIECKRCGLVYASPFIAGDSKYYNLIYQDNSAYEEWKFEYEETYNELLKITNKNLKLLEIGAGTGEFVKKVSENLVPKDNIHCTEYSEFGKHEIEKIGITCYTLDIRDPEFINMNNKYDIICMFQVLEHLDNLDDFFTKLNMISNNSAHLFIGVPNNVQRKIYDDGGMILDMPPVHLTRWNINSMNSIANRYNWSVYQHKAQPQSFLTNIKNFTRIYYHKKLAISNKIELNNQYLRRLFKMFIFPYILVRKFYMIPKLSSKTLGVVQWFHLIKQ